DYRVGGSLTGEPGTLTLRARRDVDVNASITDGFFSTRNVFNAAYQQNLADWISALYVAGTATSDINNVGGYLIGGATYASWGQYFWAPYDTAANSISPTFSSRDKIPITGADLFPLIKDPSGPIQGSDGNYRAIDSWSYRIVAGADANSANPLA